MKAISEILKETINDFINEELSINAEIVDLAKSITNDVYSAHLNNKVSNGYETFNVNSEKYVIPYYYYTNEADFSDGKKIIVYTKIYDLPNYREYDILWDKIGLGGISNADLINIICFSVDNVLHRPLFSETLSHEMEHCFQINKVKNFSNSKLYIKAVNIVRGRDNIHIGNEFNDCAYCIYMLSKKEIDANINGIYNELIERKNDFIGLKIKDVLSCSVAYNTYNTIFKKSLNNIKRNIDSEQLKSVIEYFGFTPESFVKWIDKHYKYLNSKLMKISQKLLNDINTDADLKPNNTVKVKPIIIK